MSRGDDQTRSCGHPGDGQFANVHLEKGDDFVFGSQVVYTKGKISPLGCGTSPSLTDGDTTEALRFQYCHEERVQYRCQNYYTMEGEPYKTCMNGKWIGQIRCLKPCTVDEEAMRSHNIEFRYGSEHKIYSHHNDHITFSCTKRRIPVGTSGMRFQCVDGEINLPTCQNILTHIPVCEAQQCPVIHVEQNVQVIGDPEEATYGNVVQFSCKSRTEILSGSQEMYCDENGEWRGQVPKCKEITCAVPEIENGFVSGDIPEYEENEVLYFRCDATYKRTVGRPSKCIKQGNRAEWSPTPACESIRCRLTLPPQEGTRYQSPSRIVFPPGDTLRVMCGNKYWISHPRETSAVTTCKEDGEWTFHPVCQEVVCSNQRPQHVYRWSVSWQQRITLGDTATYSCGTGYKKTDGATLAKCTRDGWNPNPLCQAITCNSQSYEEADIEGEVKTIYGSFGLWDVTTPYRRRHHRSSKIPTPP
ncbi:complement factor H-like [Anarhichas minor]|uniref:complement factor H-like n=1 Tax=Anarhichas minor TaxID=65739 RepID=UPI003F73BF00